MSGGRFEELSRAHERTKADLARATRELRELIGIGVRLAAERDTDSLLDLLLTTAREITWSDAGSLYLVDTDATGTRCLRSALVQNDSLSVAVKEHVIQIGPQSVPGYAAQSGEVINLADTYAPYAGLPFTVDRTLDQETGYRTKSMLVVPMKTPKGEVLGVLQPGQPPHHARAAVEVHRVHEQPLREGGEGDVGDRAGDQRAQRLLEVDGG